MLRMNLSFTNYQRSYYQGNTQKERKPSVKQIQYYKDLCEQKRQVPKDISTWTSQELAKEIEVLKSFYPASQAQLDRIKKRIGELIDAGQNYVMPSDTALGKLTGGREGTASKFIEQLDAEYAKLSSILPPTEKQIEFLVSMFLCPDIPFEEFNISRRIELGDGLWRRPTPEEFADEIKKKMKKNEASKFIDMHRGTFHNWKNTRIQPNQIEYIRTLEQRMQNIDKPTVVEFSVDQDGNIIQVQKQVSDKSKNWNPKAYTPIDEMELLQMSKDDASKYIDQLKFELANKELTNFGEQSDETLTLEHLRIVKNESDIKAKEFTSLQELMFKLEAIAGLNDEELHDAVTEFLVKEGGIQENKNKAKAKIREFMIDMVDNDAIDMEQLVEMIKDCPTALEILNSAS